MHRRRRIEAPPRPRARGRSRGGIRRPHSEKPPVEHERKRGHRMPIADVTAGQCPQDAASRETALDVRIRRNVLVVVEIDKIEPGRLGEDRETGQDQRRRRPAEISGCVCAVGNTVTSGESLQTDARLAPEIAVFRRRANLGCSAHSVVSSGKKLGEKGMFTTKTPRREEGWLGQTIGGCRNRSTRRCPSMAARA